MLWAIIAVGVWLYTMLAKMWNAVVPMEDLPLAMRLVDAMWSSNVTPQQIIRAMGRWRGPGLVRRAVAGRFRGQSWEADRVDAVADYLYHITAQPGSGE